MENVEVKVEGTKLTIVCDLTKRLRPSASGSTMLVATTNGIYPLGYKDLKMSFSVFTKEGLRG